MAGTVTITLNQLSASLAEEHQLTKRAGRELLDNLVSLITKHLTKGERIRIAELGILHACENTPGLSSIPPGSVAAACTADYACTIFPTKTLSDPSACGVTNRRGIRHSHQIVKSNEAPTDQLHGADRSSSLPTARERPRPVQHTAGVSGGGLHL